MLIAERWRTHDAAPGKPWATWLEDRYHGGQHVVFFQPQGDRGGLCNVVTFMIPESTRQQIRHGLAAARSRRARVIFVCDTADQADAIAKLAARRRGGGRHTSATGRIRFAESTTLLGGFSGRRVGRQRLRHRYEWRNASKREASQNTSSGISVSHSRPLRFLYRGFRRSGRPFASLPSYYSFQTKEQWRESASFVLRQPGCAKGPIQVFGDVANYEYLVGRTRPRLKLVAIAPNSRAGLIEPSDTDCRVMLWAAALSPSDFEQLLSSLGLDRPCFRVTAFYWAFVVTRQENKATAVSPEFSGPAHEIRRPQVPSFLVVIHRASLLAAPE